MLRTFVFYGWDGKPFAHIEARSNADACTKFAKTFTDNGLPYNSELHVIREVLPDKTEIAELCDKFKTFCLSRETLSALSDRASVDEDLVMMSVFVSFLEGRA